MQPGIPPVLKAEHEGLNADLSRGQIRGANRRSGQAAAKVMHSHFLKEEEYALPPLGLLDAPAKGEIEPEMAMCRG